MNNKFLIFLLLIIFQTAKLFTPDEVKYCINEVECKQLIENCSDPTKSDEQCLNNYNQWLSCINLYIDKSNGNDSFICNYLSNNQNDLQLSIQCQTDYCSNLANVKNSQTFKDLMECVNYCYGVNQAEEKLSSLNSKTAQFKALHTFTAQETSICSDQIQENVVNDYECKNARAICENDQECEQIFTKFDNCLKSQTNICDRLQGSSSLNETLQRITCPEICTRNNILTQKERENANFSKIYRCFEYCYGDYHKNVQYFPRLNTTEQFITLKQIESNYTSAQVYECVIKYECKESISNCKGNSECSELFSQFYGNGLQNYEYCQLIESVKSKQLWRNCPNVFAVDLDLLNQNFYEIYKCFSYCYGNLTGSWVFNSFIINLFQDPTYENLPQFKDNPQNQNQIIEELLMINIFPLCQNLDRCIHERQAIGSAIIIGYLIHFIFCSLTYIKAIQLCLVEEFKIIERDMFLFGFAGLLSINYLQSGIFHSIFSYFSLILLCIMHFNTMDNAFEISRKLTENKKFIQIGYYIILIIWYFGIIINYCYQGNKYFG